MHNFSRIKHKLVLNHLSEGLNEILNADWETILAAIHSLDSVKIDQLVILIDDEISMLIAGGPMIFVCSVSSHSGEYLLASPQLSHTKIIHISNGYPIGYVERHTTCLENVIESAKWFVEHKDISPALTWDRV